MEYKNSIYSLYYDWWKNIDKKILSLIIILFSLGLFFSLVSTSIIASDKLNTNSYYFFFKHLAFISLGIFVLLFFSFFEKKILINFSETLNKLGLDNKLLNCKDLSKKLGTDFVSTLKLN